MQLSIIYQCREKMSRDARTCAIDEASEEVFEVSLVAKEGEHSHKMEVGYADILRIARNVDHLTIFKNKTQLYTPQSIFIRNIG